MLRSTAANVLSSARGAPIRTFADLLMAVRPPVLARYVLPDVWFEILGHIGLLKSGPPPTAHERIVFHYPLGFEDTFKMLGALWDREACDFCMAGENDDIVADLGSIHSTLQRRYRAALLVSRDEGSADDGPSDSEPVPIEQLIGTLECILEEFGMSIDVLARESGLDHSTAAINAGDVLDAVREGRHPPPYRRFAIEALLFWLVNALPDDAGLAALPEQPPLIEVTEAVESRSSSSVPTGASTRRQSIAVRRSGQPVLMDLDASGMQSVAFSANYAASGNTPWAPSPGSRMSVSRHSSAAVGAYSAASGAGGSDLARSTGGVLASFVRSVRMALLNIDLPKPHPLLQMRSDAVPSDNDRSTRSRLVVVVADDAAGAGGEPSVGSPLLERLSSKSLIRPFRDDPSLERDILSQSRLLYPSRHESFGSFNAAAQFMGASTRSASGNSHRPPDVPVSIAPVVASPEVPAAVSNSATPSTSKRRSKAVILRPDKGTRLNRKADQLVCSIFDRAMRELSDTIVTRSVSDLLFQARRRRK